MSSFDELKQKLREIFQLDHNELDFGLYRIMKLKADEISNFIENNLLNEVKEDLKAYADDDKIKIQKEIEIKSKQIKESGLNPDDSPVIKQLKEKLKNTTSSQDIETEIYSNLYDFFKRYYEGGDFFSLRRYKKDVYALPYEGEEVKLHWANADQYYIKSSETLNNYTFILKNKEKVRFEVIQSDTTQNNNKDDDKYRYFKLAEENPVRKENNEYIISFTYLVDKNISGKNAQDNLNLQTVEILLNNSVLSTIKEELSELIGKDKKVPLILKHITDFTEKNKFDYFIHKDLGNFLNRELDFYVKNEIMQIDDIENQSLENVNKYLGKIKVFRKVAHKIIQFLSSLENFQKKIWLKKKLILETNYCITLDRVPEHLYTKIIENKAQIQEWIRLFAIDEIKGDLSKVAYTEPLTIEFLKDNPYLVLDTVFFDNDFKYELLSSMDNIDEQCNGLLINSENFQTLNLLNEKYNQKVKCIYIDPPYNTGNDGFVYKDGYKDSTWLSMMKDRLILAKEQLTDDGVIFISIDEHEISNLQLLCNNIFDKDNIDILVWQKTDPRYDKNTNAKIINRFKSIHEYLIVCYKNKNETMLGKIKKLPEWRHEAKNIDNDPRGGWNSGIVSYEEGHENEDINSEYYYEIASPAGVRWKRHWFYLKEDMDKLISDNRIYFGTKPNYSNVPRLKTFENEEQSYKCETILRGFGTSSIAKDELLYIFNNRSIFDTPKPTKLIQELVRIVNDNIYTLDFFAGSGTTGHAVINLNRQDNGNRKYILVEVEKYFDTITKTRIEKVIYSKNWKDGKPVSREGSSHCFKYIRLESYEDCLDNLKFAKEQATLPQSVQQDYMLNYMLDLETKDSLLNIKDFNHPFDYKLKITRNGEVKEVTIDLVETFNYLLGLTVESIQKIRDVIKIEGKLKNEEKTLIIWRDTTKTDNQKLDDWFKKINDSPRSSEFDVIYVNGDNNLENIKNENSKWKVRLIEQEFLKRMFDIKDI